MICANSNCDVQFKARRSNQKYCSRRCFHTASNRRYYETYRGRMIKRASDQRYFQRHAPELYEKRRVRMAGYEQEALQKMGKDPLDHDLHALNHMEAANGGATARELMGLEARAIVRIQHNWHPEPHDSRHPRFDRWEWRHLDLLSPMVRYSLEWNLPEQQRSKWHRKLAALQKKSLSAFSNALFQVRQVKGI